MSLTIDLLHVKNNAGAFVLAPASFLTFGKVNPGPPQTDFFFWEGLPPPPPPPLIFVSAGLPPQTDIFLGRGGRGSKHNPTFTQVCCTRSSAFPGETKRRDTLRSKTLESAKNIMHTWEPGVAVMKRAKKVDKDAMMLTEVDHARNIVWRSKRLQRKIVRTSAKLFSAFG